MSAGGLLLPLVTNLRAVPLIIFAIPIYLMYQWLGLLDTRLGLGLILAIVNLPLALVILVNAHQRRPIELDEAARIDGAPIWHDADPHPAPGGAAGSGRPPSSSASSPPGTSSCSG